MFDYLYFVTYEYDNCTSLVKGNAAIFLSKKVKDYSGIKELKEQLIKLEKTDKNIIITSYKLMSRKLSFIRKKEE